MLKYPVAVLLILLMIGLSRYTFSGVTEKMSHYADLKCQLEKMLATMKPHYAICFKDLSTGETFGINETEPMVAASTIKVPVLLYLYDRVAQGRAGWQDKLVYNRKLDFESGAGVLEFSARDGAKYSLRSLATQAVTTSDNVAYRMIKRYLGFDHIVNYLHSLGGETVYPGGQNLTTARDQVTYLEAVLKFAQKHPAEGNRLLDDLAHTVYPSGIPGLLPDGLVVAHKEGDLDGVANDVGIVFCKRPYLLAVLSTGAADFDQGFALIAQISKVIYDYQNKIQSMGYNIN